MPTQYGDVSWRAAEHAARPPREQDECLGQLFNISNLLFTTTITTSDKASRELGIAVGLPVYNVMNRSRVWGDSILFYISDIKGAPHHVTVDAGKRTNKMR